MPGRDLLHALLVSLDHLLDHLAADGAGFAGGQVTVVAVGQVDADFLSSLHLELVHSLTSLGNVDLVVVIVAHIRFSPLSFSGKQGAFRMERVFSFRRHILTRFGCHILVDYRKKTKKMDEKQILG